MTGQSSRETIRFYVGNSSSFGIEEMSCVDRPNRTPLKWSLRPSAQTPEQYYAAYQDVMAGLPFQEMDTAVREIMSAYERNACVFTFGNGGSAALASHFACDLGKGTLVKNGDQRRFRIISLADNISLMTAWANDQGYEHIFAEQLENLVAPGDVVFAISGSGNSPNVLRGLDTARRRGARTIGLTGFEGGKMKNLCDVCMIVPSDNMQIIEDFQLSATHAISAVIRGKMLDTAQVHRMAAD